MPELGMTTSDLVSSLCSREVVDRTGVSSLYSKENISLR